MVGHPGIDKTIERIARNYYFPGMRQLVSKVIRECDICNKAKSTRKKPYGKLEPIEPPEGAWQGIAFDFIVKLPPSTEPMNEKDLRQYMGNNRQVDEVRILHTLYRGIDS